MNMAQESRLKVKVLRTLSEIEQVHDAWKSMQWHPESDIDFVGFIVNIRPEILRPHVIVVYRNNIPVSLVAGRIETNHYEIKIGYKTIWRIPARRWVIFYGGFMGQADPQVCELVIRQLLRSLREEKTDFLMWDGVRADSELRRLLSRIPNPLCRDYVAQPVSRWIMSLPESLDELFEKRISKKHRHWAKRLMRILERDFPAAVRFQRFSAPEEMQQLFQDVLKVARKTYQWGLGAGFRDSQEQKERLLLEARNGWQRGYVLYLNEEPVAFWICIAYKDTAISAYTGYDPQYRKQEVGTVLLLHVIDQLCRERIKQLDFGRGSAFYKERFADSSFTEMSMHIFAFSGRGVLMNAARLLTEGPMNLCRSILRRLDLEQKLKKAWRMRLTPIESKNQLP